MRESWSTLLLVLALLGAVPTFAADALRSQAHYNGPLHRVRSYWLSILIQLLSSASREGAVAFRYSVPEPDCGGCRDKWLGGSNLNRYVR